MTLQIKVLGQTPESLTLTFCKILSGEVVHEVTVPSDTPVLSIAENAADAYYERMVGTDKVYHITFVNPENQPVHMYQNGKKVVVKDICPQESIVHGEQQGSRCRGMKRPAAPSVKAKRPAGQ